ncbi:MAG TPA: nucleotide sugar dehydrogenase [Anaerolineae bacterium]|nr:nucleotide sugar dehydrogenase [Anaerolineae bacterium]
MSNPNQTTTLLNKIANRQARLAVVGLGYVGLPLAVAFAEAGFHVTGIDTDPHKVDLLQAGQSYIEDVAETRIAALRNRQKITFSTDYTHLATVDCISICVPTPLTDTHEPDLSYMINAITDIVAAGGQNQLIILESTTYPGTTQELILPYLNGQPGQDFYLAFSAERIDPGRTDYTIHTTPKVMGGITPTCLQVAQSLYATIVHHVVTVSSTTAAEMVKLVENTFRAVNIGFINEVALMCHHLNLDVWEIVRAAATKPYGYMPFYPGPGLGGHCIPIDPLYLSWKLRTIGYKTRFIDVAQEINDFMPHHVINKTNDALNEDCKSIKNSNILIIGVSFKPNVSDVRESPALKIIELLANKGAHVTYHDPLVPQLRVGDTLYQSVSLTTAADADCAIIVTNHQNIDWHWVQKNVPVIVDTRNALAGQATGRLINLS